MLKPKNKGLFLDISEYAILAARTSRLEPPFVIEAIDECPVDDPEQVAAFLANFMGLKKGQYAQAVCGVYPVTRFIRRATLDAPAKVKDTAFLKDFLDQQFRIDLSKSMIVMLNAADGTEIDFEKTIPKEVIFCGAEAQDIQVVQDFLVERTIYPVRLEIGSVATLGASIRHSAGVNLNQPTLVLEITAKGAQVFIHNNKMLDVSRPIPHGFNSMYPVVQSELGLKDEESAQKLFFSNTFDFTEMGPILLKRLLKELQASTGFYEVQTGQTIGQLHLSVLPSNLAWVGQSLCRALGVDSLNISYDQLLSSAGIETSEQVDVSDLDGRWLGLFSLMGHNQPTTETKETGEKADRK
jgi:hypothetical protein